MEERRKTERIETSLQVQCETDSGVLEGTVINCSLAGCFVQGEVEEPGDEPIRLTIQLPNGTAIQLWGSVAYYLPTMGFGLHFTHLSDQSMFDEWRRYIETTKPAVRAITVS
jgi:hypothetical protein